MTRRGRACPRWCSLSIPSAGGVPCSTLALLSIRCPRLSLYIRAVCRGDQAIAPACPLEQHGQFIPGTSSSVRTEFRLELDEIAERSGVVNLLLL